MKFIIGVSGKLGSGKDFITSNVIIPVLEKLQKRYLNLNFADQIKINVITKNGINYSDVYETKTESSRQLLQKEGTEIGRTADKNTWVNYLDNWIKVHYSRGVNTFVVSDVRFMNEFDYVKNLNGIMIKIIAPKRNNIRLLQESNGNKDVYDKISIHRSECDLDLLSDDLFNLVIYNDIEDQFNIEYLQNKFELLLQKY
jgi:dephospho-CoA kinase